MTRQLSKKELIHGYKYCQKRIDVLWSKRQRVEAVLYMSLLVEHFLRESIISFEKIIEGAAVSANVGFNPRNLYSKQDIESQPLGYLIKIFDTYTKDKDLIKDLRHFAKKRNQCVHKLFGSNIREVNRELKDFDVFFYELLVKLMELNVEQMAHLHNNFKFICDSCFKDVLTRAAKF